MISRKQKRQKSRVTKTNPLKLNPKKRCVAYCVTHLRLMRSLNRRRRPTTHSLTPRSLCTRHPTATNISILERRSVRLSEASKECHCSIYGSSMGKRETKSQAKRVFLFHWNRYVPPLQVTLCHLAQFLQWNTLKKGVDTIDRLFATVKK